MLADLSDGAAKVVHGLSKTSAEELASMGKATGVGNYGFTGVWYLYNCIMCIYMYTCK